MKTSGSPKKWSHKNQSINHFCKKHDVCLQIQSNYSQWNDNVHQMSLFIFCKTYFTSLENSNKSWVVLTKFQNFLTLSYYSLKVICCQCYYFTVWEISNILCQISSPSWIDPSCQLHEIVKNKSATWWIHIHNQEQRLLHGRPLK